MSVRALPAALAAVLAAPVLVALPVLSAPAAQAVPVAPSVREIPVSAATSSVSPLRTSGAPEASSLLLSSAAQDVAGFTTVGASWETGSLTPATLVEFRVRTDGTWGSWTELEAIDTAADDGSRDAATAEARTGGRTVAEPIYVGASDGVQTRVRSLGAGAEVPTALRLTLVDPGSSAADATVTRGAPQGAAQAAAGRPGIYTRAQWGADESLLGYNGKGCLTPSYGSTIKVGFVHHTDSGNSYSAAEVPGIIRSIYAYHVKSRGWCDVGYNFLADRFGRIWEGRAGGVDRPVIGAHTGGFNTDTFAMSMIGNFTTTAPSAALISAYQRLYAWKLGSDHRDPTGTTTLVSAGTSRFASGTAHTFNVISGHRDAGSTTCPGNSAYARLGEIRSGAKAVLGAAFVEPRASTATVATTDRAVTVTGRVTAPLSWTLDVLDACGGSLLRRVTGSASSTLDVRWDLLDSTGARVRPGSYRLRLSGVSSQGAALPWGADLAVSAAAGEPGPSGSAEPSLPAGYVPVTPARVLDTREGQPLGAQGRVDVGMLGRSGIPAQGVAAVVLNVTGVCATRSTFLTAYPSGTAWPGTSSVNLPALRTVASAVVPRVGSDGAVTIYNDQGSVDVVVDVVGYFPTAAAAGAGYHPTTPVRLLDTRAGTPLAAGGTTRLDPSLQVPRGASAVVLNVTAVVPTTTTYLTVYPTSAARPATSSVNAPRGEVVPNRVVTGLGPDGTFTVYNDQGRTDVLVDLVGWYGPLGGAGDRFVAVNPVRYLDTRSGVGVARAVGEGETQTLAVAGRTVDGAVTVPEGATAVAMTLTAVSGSASTFVTAWPSGVARPNTSDLNPAQGATVANVVVVPLASDGSLALYNSRGRIHLVGDVLGYYSPS